LEVGEVTLAVVLDATSLQDVQKRLITIDEHLLDLGDLRLCGVHVAWIHLVRIGHEIRHSGSLLESEQYVGDRFRTDLHSGIPNVRDSNYNFP
jgi:hypothetical protein